MPAMAPDDGAARLVRRGRESDVPRDGFVENDAEHKIDDGEEYDQHHGMRRIGDGAAEELFHDDFVVTQGSDGRENGKDCREGGAEKTLEGMDERHQGDDQDHDYGENAECHGLSPVRRI